MRQNIHGELISVGLVGARLETWSALSHLPAFRELNQFRLSAVATTRRESAAEAAAVFGAEYAFDDYRDLIDCPAVEFVVVCVRAPQHLKVAAAALEANKAVLCEWPAGVDIGESATLAALAARRHVRSFVGLQGRFSPYVRFLRDVIKEGRIGDVVSTTLVFSWQGGSSVEARLAYRLDRVNGVTLLQLGVGHNLDAIMTCLGEIAELSAIQSVQIPEGVVAESGEMLRRTSPDQVALLGTLVNGATFAMHLKEGLATPDSLLWLVDGTEGSLRVTTDGSHLGMGSARIELLRSSDAPTRLEVPNSYRFDPMNPGIAQLDGLPSANVARMYSAIARDLMEDRTETADFEHAVRLKTILTGIEEAAASGARWVGVTHPNYP